MSDVIECLRAEIERLRKKPCTCVGCDDCHGTGTIRVDMFRGGPDPGDDLYDLETCEQCKGGIVETCEVCTEIEELYEQIEDEQERRRPTGAA